MSINTAESYYDSILEEILPNALMMGVDYDLFWTLDPQSLAPFIKAFKLKTEYDMRLIWQAGAYVQMAIASTLNKSVKYPKEPPTSNSKEGSQEVIMARFMNHAEMINSNFKE